jgi:hypothetical protein
MTARRWLGAVAAAIGAAVMLSSCSLGGTIEGNRTSHLDKTATPPTACSESWAIKPANHGNNRWFKDGVPAIKSADTPKEARAAANEWLSKVRMDPALLQGAALSMFDKDVSQKELASHGCATSKAVQLSTAMAVSLASATITPAQAPSNGYNTGVSGGKVVTASSPGVTGDTKAVQVKLANGKVIWVMARCGNPVTVGKPKLPHGPTDNPKPRCKKAGGCKPPKRHTCPPNMPHGKWPVCKDDVSKAPQHNPRFPQQQKPNPLPAKPEHRQSHKPKDPPAHYTPPPAHPKPNPTPRPDPIQTTEPAAPPPSDPAQGCSPAPGRTC